MDIITRKQALALGLKRYFTGKPCKHGHLCERYVKMPACVQCNKENSKKRHIEHHEEYLQYLKSYHIEHREEQNKKARQKHIENREENNKISRQYHIDHRDVQNEKQRAWHAAHREEQNKKRRQRRAEHREEENENCKRWHVAHLTYAKEQYAKNPEKDNARTSRRRAKRINATPIWLTQEQFLEMEGYYRVAQSITVLTGIKHHVDHIYPLQGKTSSGLHVPWNLRVITAHENHMKHNKLPDETT